MTTQQLGDVCEIIMGQAPRGDSYNESGVGVPLVAGAGNLDEGNVVATKSTTAPTKLAEPGDVIVAIRASIGMRGDAKSVVCLGRGVAALRPKPPVDRGYLWHWVGAAAPQLAAKGRGATFLQVNRDDIAKMQIPLPRLAEQRRIATVLDAATQMRQARNRFIAWLPALTEALFADTVSKAAPRLTLDSISTVAGEYGAAVSSIPFDGTRPRYVRITDIEPYGHLNDGRVSPAGEPREWRDKMLADGDIVFARSGATVGKTYLHLGDSEPSVFAGYLVRFRVDPTRLRPEYLMAYTMTSEYRVWVASQQRAVAQPNINAKQYGALLVPVPKPNIQDAFVDRFRALEHQGHLALSHLKRLDTLFASLQDRAFKGNL